MFENRTERRKASQFEVPNFVFRHLCTTIDQKCRNLTVQCEKELEEV